MAVWRPCRSTRVPWYIITKGSSFFRVGERAGTVKGKISSSGEFITIVIFLSGPLREANNVWKARLGVRTRSAKRMLSFSIIRNKRNSQCLGASSYLARKTIRRRSVKIEDEPFAPNSLNREGAKD
jgi:hypothetical protein